MAINRKMATIAKPTTKPTTKPKRLTPSKPLDNHKREAILQEMIAHPGKEHATICEKFKCAKTYISKCLREPDFAARLRYFQDKKIKNSVWSRETLIQKLQDRISKTRSDNTFVIGCGTLGKWMGLDKQIIQHELRDKTFNVNMTIIERKKDEV